MNAPRPAGPDPARPALRQAPSAATSAKLVGRDAALAHHEAFCQRVLPVMLRRLASWKGLSAAVRRDLYDELRQELAVDCLANTDTIARLSPKDRHRRWLRFADRFAYHSCLRPQRRRQRNEEPDETPAVRWKLADELPDQASAVAEGLAQGVHQFGNGRISLQRTGDQLGISARQVRKSWDYLAVQLGFGGDYRQFWQRRLVEALVGLAADRLRDARIVWVHGEHARRRPDPDGRARRLRRIDAMLHRVPISEPLRSILARTTAAGAQWRLPVSEILRDADTLDPANPTLLLWWFEAAVAEGDVVHAARCLRRAQSCGAQAVRLALGRARLREMRGPRERAAALLRRAAERDPTDPRLRHALAALSAAPPSSPASSS